MGCKQNPGEFDCYANAEPDEPLFVLLGRDRHAPTLVWLWAALRELDGEDPRNVAEARHCMAEMCEWQTAHDRAATGLGQAALAAVLELIRAANYSVAQASNLETGVDIARLFLAKTTLESDGDSSGST